MPFRFLTAGESHGEALTAIVEGIPSGFLLNPEEIQKELALRQKGIGRSGRMKIERDAVQILSGLREGKTIGSPLTLLIKNADFSLYKDLKRLETPRPGHADLVGALKFQHSDVRNTLERASARETAIRTAVGALCQNFLKNFDIFFLSYVTQIGTVRIRKTKDFWRHKDKLETSSLLCPDPSIEKKMIHYIKTSQKKGESVGGCFEVRAKGLPLGLGNFSQWDLRLDGRLAQAVMSIPAIKGVEIGEGFKSCEFRGSQYHDEIFYDGKNKKGFGFYRMTNRSGGLEGGITSGEELTIRAAMKPLPTLSKKSLRTVNIFTLENTRAFSQRTDSCAVSAASIVAKNVVAIEITRAFLEKFGGDSMKETKQNYKNYLNLKLHGL